MKRLYHASIQNFTLQRAIQVATLALIVGLCSPLSLWAENSPAPATGVPSRTEFRFRDFLPRISDMSLLENDENRSILEPNWKEARVAEVQYSYRRDSRRNRSHSGGRNDFERYEINPEGTIRGDEILALARPMERAMYDALIGSRIVDPAERARSYSEYLKRSYDQALSVLTLNRILDHEAMKRKISPLASYERVDYVKRVALVRFALETGRIPSRQVGDDIVAADPNAVPAISDDQLYAWMKEAVANQTLRFRVGWDFNDQAVFSERESLRMSEEELSGWPSEVRISFRQLPATVDAFKEELAQQLDIIHRTLVRQTVWRVLIAERKPNIQWELLFSVNTRDEQKFYETLKSREFTVQPVTAYANELTVSGAASASFLAELERRVNAKEAELTAQIRGAGVPTDPAAVSELRARVKRYRETEVSLIVSELLRGEFSDEQTAGTLRVQQRAINFENDGVTALPTDDSFLSQQKRSAFDPRFASVLFPRLSNADDVGNQHVMFFIEGVAGAPRTLPIDHPRVREALRGMMQARKQGLIFRELAFDLLRENPVRLNIDACSDPKWPCASRDITRMAEVLFPETLFPGESLGTYGPASRVQIPSTLLEPGLQDKVMTLSLDLLQAVFQAPNSHRVSRIRW